MVQVWEAMRDRVEQFRQTMPLIQDLKNKAMRERHWDALRHEINKDFDPYSSTFTLEQVFALGLHSQVRSSSCEKAGDSETVRAESPPRR